MMAEGPRRTAMIATKSAPALAAVLLLAATTAPTALAQAPADYGRAAPVEVVLTSFSFTPTTLHLHAGVPVRLTVRDTKGGHNFAAPEFFKAARLAPEDAGKVRGGKIELEGGEAVTIRLIPAAGTYKLTCTHFLHTSFGMKGSIVVD
jgi:plastocyanin